MKELVHSVIWPAVAGNVLWAFLQVAFVPQPNQDARPQRLASLLLVGLYFCIDWIESEKTKESINPKYWMVDIPLAVFIAVFAIVTQSNIWWSWIALLLAYVIVVAGHYWGAWDDKSTTSSRSTRAILMVINSLGIVVLLFGWYLGDTIAAWLTPVSIFLVVGLYLCLRNKLSR
jgi:hypothetical protein